MAIILEAEVTPIHIVWAGPIPVAADTPAAIERLNNIFDGPAQLLLAIERSSPEQRTRLKIYFWFLPSVGVTSEQCLAYFIVRMGDIPITRLEIHPLEVTHVGGTFVSGDLLMHEYSYELNSRINFVLRICKRFQIYNLIKEIVACLIMYKYGGFFFDTTIAYDPRQIVNMLLRISAGIRTPRIIVYFNDLLGEIPWVRQWGDESLSNYFFDASIDKESMLLCQQQVAIFKAAGALHDVDNRQEPPDTLQDFQCLEIQHLPYLDVWMFFSPIIRYGNFLCALKGMVARICTLFSYLDPPFPNPTPEVQRINQLFRENGEYIDTLMSNPSSLKDQLVGIILMRPHIYAWYISRVTVANIHINPIAHHPESIIHSIGFAAVEHIDSGVDRRRTAEVHVTNGNRLYIYKHFRGMWKTAPRATHSLPNPPAAFRRVFSALFGTR